MLTAPVKPAATLADQSPRVLRSRWRTTWLFEISITPTIPSYPGSTVVKIKSTGWAKIIPGPKEHCCLLGRRHWQDNTT
jgi:hypothetical protein